MGKANINSVTVQDPDMLTQVLNKMDTEIDALRTLANEIKTVLADVKAKYEDHRHSVAGAASTGTKPSTVGATAGAVASTISAVSSPTVVEQVERGR